MGVHHVAKVTESCKCIFHPIHQENDIGNDAFIEFILSERASPRGGEAVGGRENCLGC